MTGERDSEYAVPLVELVRSAHVPVEEQTEEHPAAQVPHDAPVIDPAVTWGFGPII
jgi:hypothetical protein